MKTITLAEAYKEVENIKLPSVYNSIAQDKLSEDEVSLDNKVDIILKIKAAEKASGISEIKDLLLVNSFIVNYYNTTNSNLYYKEHISKADREYVKSQFEIAKSETQYLQAKLQEQLGKVKIEI